MTLYLTVFHFDMLCKMTQKFIRSCLASSNDAVNFVARNGVHYGRMSSCGSRSMFSFVVKVIAFMHDA